MVEQHPGVGRVKEAVQYDEVSLWGRRSSDTDFLVVRCGVGDVVSPVKIKLPSPDISTRLSHWALEVYNRQSKISKCPVVFSFREGRSVSVIGRRDDVLPVVRNLMLQVVTSHTPEDVQVVVLSSEHYRSSWSWARWLPHSRNSRYLNISSLVRFGSDACMRMLYAITDEFDPEKDKDGTAGRHTIVVLDGQDIVDEVTLHRLVNNGPQYGYFPIIIGDTLSSAPEGIHSVIEVQDEKFTYSTVGDAPVRGSGAADRFSLVEADKLSRKLSSKPFLSLGVDGQVPRSIEFLDMMGVTSIPGLDISQRWGRIPERDGLLPFPVDVGGVSLSKSLSLHLAENRDGPHGMVAGTTGSGKSEFLQTLVCALAVDHHPYYVSFLLVDFKGGATFSSLASLPHTVGFISNLDRHTAVRALEAIRAEVLRRQRFLSRVGFEDILEYHKEVFRQDGIPANWEPMPHLFIVVDEFAEMAKEMPDFLNDLNSIGRVGRSLGVHMILATQRPAGVVKDEVRSNLTMRVCLRVQTTDDSRDVLRRTDAAFLRPDLPGRAYFQAGDGGTPAMFQVARVGGDYDTTQTSDGVSDQVDIYIEDPLNGEYSPLVVNTGAAEEKSDRLPILAEVLAAQMKTIYDQMLSQGDVIPLDQVLLPDISENLMAKNVLTNELRWDHSSRLWGDSAAAGVQIPVAVVDDLMNRRQPVLSLDLGQGSGNTLVAGGPATGKTTALRSIICNVAMCYDPSQVHIYVLSYGGRELVWTRKFPHVGDVVTENETERVYRLFALLRNIVEERKDLFSRAGSDNLLIHNSKMLPENRLPNILVLVDNIGGAKGDEEALSELLRLSQEGRVYGVHFVFTALRVADVPGKLMGLLEFRLGLYLSDPSEYSAFIGKVNKELVKGLPAGRGIAGDGLVFQFMLPDDDIQDTAEVMRDAWKGDCPDEIKTIPTYQQFPEVRGRKG